MPKLSRNHSKNEVKICPKNANKIKKPSRNANEIKYLKNENEIKTTLEDNKDNNKVK